MCVKSYLHSTLRCCTDHPEKKGNTTSTQGCSCTHHVFIDEKALSHCIENILHEGNIFLCCIGSSEAGHTFTNPHRCIRHSPDDPQAIAQLFPECTGMRSCDHRN